MLIVIYSQIFVGDGNMITVEDNHIDIFQMPHLHPCRVDEQVETDRPLVTLNHACQNEWTTLISRDCSWHTPDPMSPHLMARRFDLISKMDDGACIIGHYVIEPLGKSKQNRLPRWLPLLFESTHLPFANYNNSKSHSSAWTEPDEFLFFWVQDGRLMASVTKMPTMPGVPAEVVGGSMSLFREGITNPSVCPYSGRVVMYDGIYSEIRVMDYVA
jgi:hypothetical protein